MVASSSICCESDGKCDKRAKSQVWRYFGFPGDDSGVITKKKVVICRLCPDNDEFPYAGNTMNLVTHLERHHKTKYLGDIV